MIVPLKITNSAFDFTLPLTFLPQYGAHDLAVNPALPADFFQEAGSDWNELVSEYTYEYCFQITDSRRVTWVGAPADSKSTK